MRLDTDSIQSFLAGTMFCTAVAGMLACVFAPLLNAQWLWTAGWWLMSPFLVCLVLAGSVAGILGPFYNLWRVVRGAVNFMKFVYFGLKGDPRFYDM